jgi:hypothetical protein
MGRSVSVAPLTGLSLINAFIVFLLVILLVHAALCTGYRRFVGRCRPIITQRKSLLLVGIVERQDYITAFPGDQEPLISPVG